MCSKNGNKIFKYNKTNIKVQDVVVNPTMKLIRVIILIQQS